MKEEDEAEERKNKLDVHKTKRFAIREALEPLLEKSRRIVTWNANHPEFYNAQEYIAKEKGHPWKRFERETACRWSSQLSMLESVLHNNATLVLMRAAAEAKFPIRRACMS